MRDAITRAYLDIETTGLSPESSSITVVGVYIVRPDGDDFKQFCGYDWAEELLALVRQVDHIYTYNGTRFDLPFIQEQTGLALHRETKHTDLMYNCWQKHLRGGLKSVERQLGIYRALPDIDGMEAVRLWYRYITDKDQKALDTLLAYNKEDCVNLHHLRQKLGVS